MKTSVLSPSAMDRAEMPIRSDPAHLRKRPSALVVVVFNLLNPVPFGLFVAALIFDLVYGHSAEVLWFKSAAWLITIGLVFAVIPRVINLFQVWFHGPLRSDPHRKVAFFFNLFGIALAIVNAFVHSRDAYAVMPEGAWLSVFTVASMAIGVVFESLPSSSVPHEVKA